MKLNEVKSRGITAATAAKLMCLGLTVYTLFFFFLAHLKFKYCTNHSADIAIFNHAFWATLRGDFFPVNALGMSWFGDKTGGLLLLVLPIYWLAPSPYTLLFISCMIIAFSAVPIYWLAAQVWRDRTAALLMSAAYLFFPTIVSQNVNQIQMLQFVVMLLVLALLFIRTERYGMYLACCGAALLLGTEDVGLTMLMFLPYALINRKVQWYKWVMLSTGFVIVWLFVSFNIIMPIFRGDRPYRPLEYLSSLGNSPAEIMRTLLTDPRRLLSAVITFENFVYLICLLQPLAYITPWYATEVVFVLPYLSLNLVASNIAMKNIAWHYNVTVGMFLIVASIFSVRKWAEIMEKKWGQCRYEVGFAFLFLCLAVTSWPLWLNVLAFRPRPYYAAQMAAMSLVPRESSVVAPETMVAHFSERWRFNTLHGIKRWGGELESYEFIILDANDRINDPLVTVDLIKSLAAHPAYDLIFNKHNVLVFRKKKTSEQN